MSTNTSDPRHDLLRLLSMRAVAANPNPTPPPGTPPAAKGTKTHGERDPGFCPEDAEPWLEAVIGAQLPDDLRDTIKRYVVLPPMAAETLALWTLHTYAFELRDVSTYIGLGSPQKRCGKTTLLGVLS